jgi:hypothetical protein
MSADDVSWWANWILVGALLVGVAATYAIVVSGNIKEANLKRELKEKDDALGAYKLTVEGKVADAKSEGIKAGEAAGNAMLRAAELEKQTAELTAENLALQKLMQPRRLPPSTALGLFPQFPDKRFPQEWARFNIVAPFKGTPVVIQSVPDFEAIKLAQDINGALIAFGWQSGIVLEAGTGVSPMWISEGLEITYPQNGRLREAAVALANALSIVGLTGPEGQPDLTARGYNVGADGNPVMRSVPHFQPARDTVVVLVGMKPIPALAGGAPK